MHFISEDLENYVANHSQAEPELLAKLNKETHQKILQPRMLSGHFQGRVLSMLSKIINPKHILELGTYTGYATLCMVEGLCEDGTIDTIDINEEFAVQQAVMQLIEANLIQSAHDIAEGGLWINLLESGFNRNLGFSINALPEGLRADAYLFGEAQSRIVISVKPEQLTEVQNALKDVPVETIGTVTQGDIHVFGHAWGAIGEWHHAYETAIENTLQ